MKVQKRREQESNKVKERYRNSFNRKKEQEKRRKEYLKKSSQN